MLNIYRWNLLLAINKRWNRQKTYHFLFVPEISFNRNLLIQLLIKRKESIMEYAGDPTYESIFTSKKVTNIFESLSKDENILETDLFRIVDGDIIVSYYAETFHFQDCAVCYFANFTIKTLFAPYIRVYSKNKIHFGCRAEYPYPAFYDIIFSNVPQRYIKMNGDDIHYVFDLLSIKKELLSFVICDFLSHFEEFYFHVEEWRLADFARNYTWKYRRK